MPDYTKYQTRLQTKKRAFISYILDKILGLFIKSKPKKLKKLKKILIIRNDHIGDVALCTQIYRELKRKFPSVEITAMVPESSKALLEKNPNVDKIIPFGMFWRSLSLKSFKKYLKIRKRIKKEKFDFAFDIRASFWNMFFFMWMCNIKNRASYYNITGGKPLLTHPIKYEKIEHTIKFDMDLVAKVLDFNVKNYWPEIITDKSDGLEIESFLKKNNLKKYICICPAASYAKKQFDLSKLDILIKWVRKEHPNVKIILSGGKNDKEVINSLHLKNPDCLKVINFNLRRLSLLFKKSELVIANDGGPMHLAWISGTKVIALEGPVNLDLNGPLKNSVIIVGENRDIKNIKMNRIKKEIKKILK